MSEYILHTHFLADLERIIFSFAWKHTHTKRIAKTLLNNQRTAGGVTTPDFKLYHRALVIKTV